MTWRDIRARPCEEDRDTRDMAWDYRVTGAASVGFHAHFQAAYWSGGVAVAVGGVRATLLPSNETSDAWRSHRGFEKDLWWGQMH